MENLIEVKPVELDEKYRKKWRVNQTDFVNLYKNGVKLNDTLYRVGGFGFNPKDKYFMILKQVESFYDKSIMDSSKDFNKKQGTKFDSNPRHLANCACIIDNDGVEKKVFAQSDSPYLIGGCVYSIGDKYYNIETDEYYCTSYSRMKSKDFIFLNNEYDKDKTKRGILRIDKLTGETKLFKL